MESASQNGSTILRGMYLNGQLNTAAGREGPAKKEPRPDGDPLTS